MLDLSVIILTYNEAIHLRRCIENILPIAKDIYIIDSFSKDATTSIARDLGAIVYSNKWENNHARQFNWGLEHLPISTRWVLRLDADEYLTNELIAELNAKLPAVSQNVTGIIFKRRQFFLGKWMKRGTYPIKLLRLFEYKKGHCEERWMDEHIRLIEGKSVEFDFDFVDHNLNNLSWWISKHNGYSIREAIDLLDIELDLLDKSEIKNVNQLTNQAATKRNQKYYYSRLPLLGRAFIYFIYRYLFRFGFIEGKEGFLWHFLQGWWYRTLVDAKISEIKKECGTDKNKIKEYIYKQYSIQL